MAPRSRSPSLWARASRAIALQRGKPKQRARHKCELPLFVGERSRKKWGYHRKMAAPGACTLTTGRHRRHQINLNPD